MNVWVGDNYERSTHRILVLGESWYSDVVPLAEYVPRWASKAVVDMTLSRLFNAASGSHTDRATHAERLAWWNGIAFYNFVHGTVGNTSSDRPTPAMYIAARECLPPVLDQLRPRGVWILGKEQAEYSAELVQRFGASYEVTSHPTSWGLPSAQLAASWTSLLERVRNRNA
ncbi:MAG: hypothetical protein K2Q20_04785 [Phycisphaerales bacterium]|nr:hypothetical protein [Phycisphaerales bacterium]